MTRPCLTGQDSCKEMCSALSVIQQAALSKLLSQVSQPWGMFSFQPNKKLMKICKQWFHPTTDLLCTNHSGLSCGKTQKEPNTERKRAMEEAGISPSFPSYTITTSKSQANAFLSCGLAPGLAEGLIPSTP